MGVQVALPGGLAGGRVDRDQIAVEEGEEDAALVVDRRGDEGRRAGEAMVGDPFPEDFVVAQPYRPHVAELVGDIGDAAGERGRELDQRMRVDRPRFAQRRIEVPPFVRQVMGALRHTAEERPVDERGGAGGIRPASGVRATAARQAQVARGTARLTRRMVCLVLGPMHRPTYRQAPPSE